MASISPVFAGERIYLRELQHADVTERYLSWFRDPEVTRFLGVRDLTYREVTEYMDFGRESGTYFMYALCLIASDLHIGNVKVGPIDRAHKRSNLVTVIGDRAYWGRGLGTEAVRVGSRVAFDIHGVRKLSSWIDPENSASIRAYVKAGWIMEATLKEHFIRNGSVKDTVCVACFNHNWNGLTSSQEVDNAP